MRMALSLCLLAVGITVSEALSDFDALWDYSNPAGTEAAFRELLPAAETSGDESYHLQLLTQIARAQGLQQRFDDAHATLDLVEKRMGAGADLVRVRYLLERGRTLNSSRSPERARPLFLESYEIARRARLDFYAVDAAHMMGIVEKGDGSLLWNETALELAEASADDRARGWRGSLYNNIGWTCHDMGEYEKALGLFEKALSFREKQGGDDGEISIARWCVARCLRSLGRTEEALAIQRLLEKRGDERGSKDGYVYEEIGECLLALGRGDESKPYFRSAWKELSKDNWLARDEPDRLARLKELGG